ncbi:MAG: hypothetical protein KDA22_08445 [Phycisphaerales bacterium]|nr:hypothetical protein [Phycisphaerales bacterium]
MARTSPLRWLLTLLLAGCMPFCCCNLHRVLGDRQTPEARVLLGAGDDDHGHADDRGGTGCCHGGRSCAADEGHDGGAPPGHDNAPCPCDQNKVTALDALSAGMPVPALSLVGTLPRWEVVAWSSEYATVRAPAARSLPRPPTSLLRQHCALIV